MNPLGLIREPLRILRKGGQKKAPKRDKSKYERVDLIIQAMMELERSKEQQAEQLRKRQRADSNNEDLHRPLHRPLKSIRCVMDDWRIMPASFCVEQGPQDIKMNREQLAGEHTWSEDEEDLFDEDKPLHPDAQKIVQDIIDNKKKPRKGLSRSRATGKARDESLLAICERTARQV